jgi:hypothetical protein
MGVDPALVDAAAKIPFRSFRGLSRGEMEQFGFETRGAHETPWFAYHESPDEFLLLKSVTLVGGAAGDEFRTRTVGLACGPLHQHIRFIYRQELTSKESRSPPMLRAKIGDSLIDLTADPNKDSLEKSFDIEPRQLHGAIESGRFEITETLDRAAIKMAPPLVKFSTSGIWAEIAALEKCASKNNSRD